jgi:hypothetical protein
VKEGFISAAAAAISAAVEPEAHMHPRVTNQLFVVWCLDALAQLSSHRASALWQFATPATIASQRATAHITALCNDKTCCFNCYSNVSGAVLLKQLMQPALVQCRNT